jgi:hypothetical protein
MTRLVVAALLIAGLLAGSPPTLANADDPGCSDKRDECEIVVVIDDSESPSNPHPDDPATTTKKVVPDCDNFGGGVVVTVGVTLADLGLDDAAHDGWRRFACRLAGEDMWIWMDPGENAESIARTLLARLQLKAPKIGWTPTEAGGMGYVGVPTWLWVADPARLTWGPATISAAGVSLTARAESVTWSMGNGDEVRCANQGTPWRKGMGAGPSPSCGYLYERQGTYEVTATVHWVARWSGYGRSGAIPLSLSQERTLEVGEIQVIVTNR